MIDYLIRLPQSLKGFLVLLVDLLIVCFAVWMSFYIRLGYFYTFSEIFEFRTGFPVAAIVSSTALICATIIFKSYSEVLRFGFHLSPKAIITFLGPLSVAVFSSFTIIGIDHVPRTLGILVPIIGSILLIGTRYFIGIMVRASFIRNQLKTPVALLYCPDGTNDLTFWGSRLGLDFNIAGYLDASNSLVGRQIGGVSVHAVSRVREVVEKLKVDYVLVSEPSPGSVDRRTIFNQLDGSNVRVRFFSTKMVRGPTRGKFLKPNHFNVDDLLPRESMIADKGLLEGKVRGKVVLVTGAGGSIGSELCRQIVRLECQLLITLDHSELALYSLLEDLTKRSECEPEKIVAKLGSVLDEVALNYIFEKYKPQTVFHAAAFKHVPLVEDNPVEGFRNNAFGTLNLIIASQRISVENFVLISTDKAVRPQNVMGLSKRFSELLVQGAQQADPKTKYCIVRFGNVLGSSGSVVPKFLSQIANGQPLTVTHPQTTRYFMSIREAAQLVIQASSLAEGGDVFVLDMGQPISIYSLAEKIIRYSGFVPVSKDFPDGDFEITITGLRAGEKVHEELLIGTDPHPTSHPRIIRANEPRLGWVDVMSLIKKFEAHFQEGRESVNFCTIQAILTTVGNPT